MNNKIHSWMNSLLLDGKLRTKLLVIYFVLLLLPLGLFTLYAFNRISAVIQEQTFFAAQKAFDDTQRAADDLFGRLTQVVDILAMDSSLYTMAARDSTDYSYIQRLDAQHNVSTTFEHLRSLSGIDRIRMYVSNDYLYTDSADIISLESVENSHWFKVFPQGESQQQFAPADFADQPPDEQSWYSVVRVIYDLSHVQEPLALIRADISAARVDAAVGRSIITQNSAVFLLDSERVFSSSALPADSPAAGIAIQMRNSNPFIWNDVKTNKGRFHIQYVPLTYPGWELATVLPHADVFRASRKMQLELLTVVLLLALAAYLIAYKLSESILQRLLRLTDTMHAVEQGNVSAFLEPVGEDEIGQLMQSFGNMMAQIDTLMDEKLEHGLQIKALELKALQAQINPHFLYNSLDLINCTAIANNIPQISQTVHALAQFYRLSLSRGREVIPLADELKHARLYIEIQNMRFENRVRVEWDIDKDVEQCQIIKIVLQPIIENAIIHGIFEKPNKTGTLKISARRFPDGIRIAVQDNGVGMDHETAELNFSSETSSANTGGGYGVRNINERLHLAYGLPYGLSLKTQPGIGTEVTVLIPAIEQLP